MKSRIWLLGAITDSLFCSLITMWLVQEYLSQRISIWGEFIGLERTFNSGIAFGMQLGAFQDVFIFLALIAIIYFAVTEAKSVLQQIGFGFIIGGGIANIIDRAIDGTVVDMIQIGTFPVFNIADTCINIGVILLIYVAILNHCRTKNL